MTRGEIAHWLRVLGWHVLGLALDVAAPAGEVNGPKVLGGIRWVAGELGRLERECGGYDGGSLALDDGGAHNDDDIGGARAAQGPDAGLAAGG